MEMELHLIERQLRGLTETLSVTFTCYFKYDRAKNLDRFGWYLQVSIDNVPGHNCPCCRLHQWSSSSPKLHPSITAQHSLCTVLVREQLLNSFPVKRCVFLNKQGKNKQTPGSIRPCAVCGMLRALLRSATYPGS